MSKISRGVSSVVMFLCGRLAMPCPRCDDMKARHSISAREISSPQRNMMQMKICKEDILPGVSKLPLFDGCAPEETTEILVELMGSIRGFAPGEVIVHE